MIHQKGFTLIESIIYLALFAIVIGGGMVAVYQIIQSTEANTNHVILQEEANFLIRKLQYEISKNNSLAGVIFDSNAHTLSLNSIVLNSSSVPVTAFSFHDQFVVNFSLATAQNGRGASQDFTFTKYLRQ